MFVGEEKSRIGNLGKNSLPCDLEFPLKVNQNYNQQGSLRVYRVVVSMLSKINFDQL